jgi:aerobic-type carbon monoxide dehydrogenase small subunit (CoxS/CutS family)
MAETLKFTLNGKPVSVTTAPDRALLWLLRGDLGLTGTKFSCGENHCGACAVVVSGRVVRSCKYPARAADGKEVTTIEGLGGNGVLHPLQAAFAEHDALQCGFCTPGMIMTAYALLMRSPDPSRGEIVSAMDDSLCRCGSHTRIIAAIESAAQAMKEGEAK